MVAAINRGCANTLQVGSGTGLSHRNSRYNFPRNTFGQKFLLLRLVAHVLDVGHHDIRVQNKTNTRHTQVRQLFSHNDVVAVVCTGATVRLRNGGA